MKDARPSVSEIAAWVAVLIKPGQIVEIRAPKATVPGRSGTVDKHERHVIEDPARDYVTLARAALDLSGKAPAVYFTLNPLRDGIADGVSATDADVVRRALLLVDCDPERKGTVSATDAEKKAARSTLIKAVAYLAAQGWPAPVEADSGNGYHAVYGVDLPADDETGPDPKDPSRTVKLKDGPSTLLIKAVLESLAARFNTSACKIDTKVYNASRITKLYGTEAKKGVATDERPHRFSRVLSVPEEFVVVTREQLQAVADDRPKPAGGKAAAAQKRGVAKGRVPWGPMVVGASWTPEQRAAEWLKKCAPAISGQRGHDALLWAASVGPKFDLSEETTLRLLTEVYNPTCSPEWSEKELRHKVQEAFKLNPERGTLLNAGRNGKAEGGHNGNGRANGRPGAAPASPERRVIVMTHKLHEVVEEAVQALAEEHDVYQRGSDLTQIIFNVKPPRGMEKTEGTPQIATMPVPRLLEVMSRAADWQRQTKSRNGDACVMPSAPTEQFAKMVANRGFWPGIRPLEGIIEAPTLRPDGSIIQEPGYDAATGLFFRPNATFPQVPEHPTKDEARESANRLADLVADFPFASEPHRLAWLAACLTVVVRFAVEGPCPLFLFDANTSGSGKTKLCDIISIIASGRDMPRSGYSSREEEMAKQILSVALGGFRFVLFDNLQTGDSLGGAALDRALTAMSVNDRLLGSSKMSGEIPLYVVFFATGNNLGIKGDGLRRIVPCRLDSPEERPEERSDFKIKDILAHVREHRAALVVDALTVVRAYVVAGRPACDLPPMDYAAWCGLVRNAVFWATGTDPCETRKERIAEDEQADMRAAVITSWENLCRGEGRDAMTVSEAIKALNDSPESYGPLREIFFGWSKDGITFSPRVIGNRFAKIRGQVSRFLTTEAAIRKTLEFSLYLGNKKWSVKTLGGSGGSGGSDRGSLVGDQTTVVKGKDNTLCSAPRVDAQLNHQSHQNHHEASPDWVKNDIACWLTGFLDATPVPFATVQNHAITSGVLLRSDDKDRQRKPLFDAADLLAPSIIREKHGKQVLWSLPQVPRYGTMTEGQGDWLEEKHRQGRQAREKVPF